DYQAASFTVPSAYLMPYTQWDFKVGFNTGYSWSTFAGNFGVGLGITSGLTSISYDTDKYRPSSLSLRNSVDNWVLGNKVSARVYLNRLDYWVNPSSGYYASEKVTVAGFLETEPQHYIRSDSRLDGFLTLFSYPLIDAWKLKMVLGAHTGFQAMFAEPGRSDPIVLTSDALHIDGTFIGRGWHSLSGYDGVQLWENWLELRMPIFESVVWVDGFVEGAAVRTAQGLVRLDGTTTAVDTTARNFSDLSWNNWALSAGVGFRFTVPQFPFRFYFAKRAIFDGQSISYPNSNLDFVISISQPLN
ncbi:MAG: BamA/TamA family outer membrane protein, partial [Spirochaetota bacterium]